MKSTLRLSESKHLLPRSMIGNPASEPATRASWLCRPRRPPHICMCAPYVPTELVERIIDHAADDEAALRSCSVVARAWRPRALTHIFRSVQIHGPGSSAPRLDGIWRLYHVNVFTLFLRDVPQLAVFMRRIALHAETMSSNDFECLLLAILDSQSALPFYWEMEHLLLSG